MKICTILIINVFPQIYKFDDVSHSTKLLVDNVSVLWLCVQELIHSGVASLETLPGHNLGQPQTSIYRNPFSYGFPQKWIQANDPFYHGLANIQCIYLKYNFELTCPSYYNNKIFWDACMIIFCLWLVMHFQWWVESGLHFVQDLISIVTGIATLQENC